MRETQKTVYYCDFCKKHGLSRTAMEKHEAICTLNPVRLCRWRIDGHSDGKRLVEIVPLAEELRRRCVSHPLSADPESPERTYLTKDDIEWLHDEVAGCPACQLAALRQSGVEEWHLDYEGETIFSYEGAVEEARRAERAADEALVW